MELLTTVERVKTILGSAAEDFDLNDDQISMCIEDAGVEVHHESFPANVQEQATRYFAAHLLALTNNAAAQGIAMEKVGDLQTQYATTATVQHWYQQTRWGAEYYRLWKEYCHGDPLNLLVLG
ncbi:DUF4054 domain-containing protein [Lactiplantibacillus mudanjiangensis]|uniref:DUF4054 domain-containing protein n=1 Tax=Lactiplantibacillus mudanjiangensis TaxID=1296538 RepID=A0A660E075_9LACO|nr:DUF4054 domain-containing protein [Lactiplantibacillus mudanjiangensis]VDG23671.1 hypothetical protein [Lactobacillus parabuchneri] [Lactiplantibacillus mudanjiangensis]VDG27814.1 hypothetical protein [Lactobacillus parabuchneri] [Lactiplantibacillus mudanjiangensis]